jgi:hypothetical protein
MLMSDVIDYDKSIIKTLHHIEEVLVKFALQNYASAGAVFLAYFSGHLSLKMSTAVVVGLGIVFAIAIGVNITRYRLLWRLHRVARDTWLAGQSPLREAYRKDKECEDYLSQKELPYITCLPVIIINLVPALAALLLLWRRS